MTTAPFTRIYNPGKFEAYTDKRHEVFVEVKWDGERLSITGVEGPRPNGDCWGGCGQIRPLTLVSLAPGWTTAMVARLNEIWDRWHLNDLRPGTPAQMEWCREHPQTSPLHSYDNTKRGLAEAGLDPDPETGYQYGHAWLTEEVPDEILAELLDFPATTKPPAWV